jgi:membrane protease YdiL (CAAX protease family)
MIENKNTLFDYSTWKWAWVVFLGFLYYFIANIVSLEIAKIIVSDEWLQSIQEKQIKGLFLSISCIINLVIFYFPILWLINQQKNTNIKQYIGLKKVSIKTVFMWLAVFFLLIASTNTISYFMENPIVPEYVVQMFQTIKSTPWLILGIVIAAPIYEELFFRGFLYSSFISMGVPVWIVIIITAFIFAALHNQYEMYIKCYIFSQGVFLGFARDKSGSVILTIIIHSFISSIAIAQIILFGAL